MIKAKINFDKKIRNWDGFGFNYVQTSMTKDYDKFPQDYGGFSILPDKKRREILNMVFGVNGLKPGLIKMFLDPLHQDNPKGKFDHETTTQWMTYFVREGLKQTRSRGEDLKVLTTLYGPPAWATKQRELRGRDLDPQRKYDLAEYMIDWLTYLRQNDIPVKYLSLHNQGDKPYEYPEDGSGKLGDRIDYNGYWPPDQVVDFLTFLKPMLEKHGLEGIGLTPGETSRWHYFSEYGYAAAIEENEEALNNLGLITSHGFHKAPFSEWFGEQRSTGVDRLRAERSDLHAWVGSSSWLDMSAKFLKEIYGNIYTAKVNGYIPWAGLQRPQHWEGKEWNPGTAFKIRENGTYEVQKGYYYYKQACRAGQPGMAVADTIVVDKQVFAMAFAKNGTNNPDAFIIINLWDKKDKNMKIEIKGHHSDKLEAYRTTDDEKELYSYIGKYSIDGSHLEYKSPASSVTTFYCTE